MLKSLHFSDLLVLTMAMFGIGGAARLVGITDPFVVVVLSMGWTCPAARRLIAWRRGRSVERQISMDDPSGAAMVLLFGALPWVLLPLLHELNPGAMFGTVVFPTSIKIVGGLMTMAGILAPLWLGRLATAPLGAVGVFEAIGLFAVSGSVPFACLTLAALTVQTVGRAELRWMSPEVEILV